jgi:hypothetical protein
LSSEPIQDAVQGLLAKASEATAKLDWVTVASLADAALKLDPENTDALIFKSTALEEINGQKGKRPDDTGSQPHWFRDYMSNDEHSEYFEKLSPQEQEEEREATRLGIVPLIPRTPRTKKNSPVAVITVGVLLLLMVFAVISSFID